MARSFSGRRWQLAADDEAVASDLIRNGGLSEVLAHLLAARGVDAAAAPDYLNPTLKKLMPDPLVLAEMDKAVARVVLALEHGQHIAVFGDYDVDGSVSAALLAEFLAGLGAAPRLYIPDRMAKAMALRRPLSPR